jgi:hypothetical protein
VLLRGIRCSDTWQANLMQDRGKKLRAMSHELRARTKKIIDR